LTLEGDERSKDESETCSRRCREGKGIETHLNLNIVLLLIAPPVVRSLTHRSDVVVRSVLLLLPLLVLLLLLGSPNLVDVEELDSDGVSVESSVSISGSGDLRTNEEKRAFEVSELK